MQPPAARTSSRLVRHGALLGALLALLLVDGTAVAAPHAPTARTSSSASLVLPTARTADRVTLRASASEFRKRESIRLSGKVFRGGSKVGKGVRVNLFRTRLDNGKTKRVARLTTNAKGKFVLRVRPGRDVVYQARVGGGRSPQVTLTRTTGDRTLKQRRATVRKQLGKPRGKARTLSAKQLKRLDRKNISHVRSRDFRKGFLVQVTKKGTTRTWFVRGKIAKAYRKAGGPTGRYGVPFGDAKCGLLENGCLQRFTGGSLFERKGEKKAAGQVSRRKASQVLAAARSQLSYRSGRTNSKFNTWAGSWGQPWCATFISWVAAASGKRKVVPKFARLYQLAPYARKNMKTYGRSAKRKPKLGHLAFFDFRNQGRGPEPSHVGIVIEDRGSTVLTIEGNASRSATFTSQRGVFIHERPKSRVVFYAIPGW